MLFTNVDATIYKWRDKNGITHYTDNLTKVPKAFREKLFTKRTPTPKNKIRA